MNKERDSQYIYERLWTLIYNGHVMSATFVERISGKATKLSGPCG